MPSRPRPPPLANRGAGAWERDDVSSIWAAPEDRHPLVLPVVTRAQVHAVTDDTNHDYIRAVSAALEAMEAGVRAGKWSPPQTIEDLDCLLVAICDDLIYAERKGAAFGQKLHAAWAHVFPNQIAQLHGFARACTGWARMLPGREGFGLCEERWAAIGAELLALPSEQDREAAVWWFLQCDVYAREQEMENLRNTKEDWVKSIKTSGAVEVALFFGVQSRGETAKTSTTSANQGVIIERPWVARLFLELASKRQVGEYIFKISRTQLASRVRIVCDKLGIPVPVMHVLRHTGPANATLKGLKSLEKIRRRGRWASLKSVERYSKTAHLVACLSSLPAEARRLGEAFLLRPEDYVLPRVQQSVRFSA